MSGLDYDTEDDGGGQTPPYEPESDSDADTSKKPAAKRIAKTRPTAPVQACSDEDRAPDMTITEDECILNFYGRLHPRFLTPYEQWEPLTRTPETTYGTHLPYLDPAEAPTQRLRELFVTWNYMMRKYKRTELDKHLRVTHRHLGVRFHNDPTQMSVEDRARFLVLEAYDSQRHNCAWHIDLIKTAKQTKAPFNVPAGY